MSKLRKTTQILLITAYLLLFFVQSAYAYIDPGSGSLILQMLMAALVGMLFYLKRIIKWLKTFLRRKDNE